MKNQKPRARLLPFQPATMTPAQLAAVSFLARFAGATRHHYADQLRRWFSWCEANALDPLVGIERAHVELYIRYLGDHIRDTRSRPRRDQKGEFPANSV